MLYRTFTYVQVFYKRLYILHFYFLFFFSSEIFFSKNTPPPVYAILTTEIVIYILGDVITSECVSRRQ